MTREEQIQRESEVYALTANQFDIQLAFIKGVEWADENPKFSKEEFIEKAAEWIRDNVYLYVSDLSGTVFEQQLTEAFTAAMEE